MVLIFALSSQTADNSTQTSEFVSRLSNSFFFVEFDDLSAAEQDMILENMARPIRKCAHAAEYIILAVLLSGVFEFKRKKLIFAWLFTVLYSITDEIHQIYVPGRTGKITDVINDSLAALVGVAVVFAVVTILNKSRDKDK